MQTTLRRSGFTLVEIMIVVAIILLLAAIAIPNFIVVRENSIANACITNLKNIEVATQELYKLQNQSNSVSRMLAPTEADTQAYVIKKLGYWPVCPKGGKYVLGNLSEPPTCTYTSSDPHRPHALLR